MGDMQRIQLSKRKKKTLHYTETHIIINAPGIICLGDGAQMGFGVENPSYLSLVTVTKHKPTR